jgi:hypothetical protein
MPKVLALALLSTALACGGGSAEEPEDDAALGPRPYFSFFVTSQSGLTSLPAGRFSPEPDRVDGFGGNLGGLEGADEICTMLAQRSNPGDVKVWRAFLSTSGLVSGVKVQAIDRIGTGPWFDFRGFKLADDLGGRRSSARGDVHGRKRRRDAGGAGHRQPRYTDGLVPRWPPL